MFFSPQKNLWLLEKILKFSLLNQKTYSDYANVFQISLLVCYTKEKGCRKLVIVYSTV